MGRRYLAGLVLIALLLPACSSGVEDGDEADSGGSVFDVRQMLRRRATALARGQLEEYMRPVGPEAKVTEQKVADGSRLVPITAIQLVFRPDAGVSLDAKSFRRVPTDFIFRYKGLPEDNNFRFRLFYDVQQIKKQWTVTRSEMDPESIVPDWLNGPVEVKNSPHFLVLHRPGMDRVSEALDEAEKARSNLAGKLSLLPDAKHLLLLARNHEEFQGIIGRPEDEGTLALARAASDDGGFPRNREMIVDLQAVLDPTGLAATHGGGEIKPIQVFQHELGHLFLMRHTSPLTPDWVAEGAAMYLSGERRIDAWGHMSQTGLLDRELTTILAPPETELDSDLPLYPYANAAVSYLTQAFGEKRFWELYRGYKLIDQDDLGAVSVGRAQVEATHELLRKIYRIDEVELDLRVRQWIKEELAAPAA